jgi:hypothetical protein
MFGLARKVITRGQLRTVKAGRSDFVRGVKGKLNEGSHIKKKETKEFWSQLRHDSMAGGRRTGLTRKGVQESLAKILIKARKGEGHINKREVKDLIGATGVSQKKVFQRASEMSHEKNTQVRHIGGDDPSAHGHNQNIQRPQNDAKPSFERKITDFQGRGPAVPMHNVLKPAAAPERSMPVLRDISGPNIQNKPLQKTASQKHLAMPTAGREVREPTDIKEYLARLQSKNEGNDKKNIGGEKILQRPREVEKRPGETHEIHAVPTFATVGMEVEKRVEIPDTEIKSVQHDAIKREEVHAVKKPEKNEAVDIKKQLAMIQSQGEKGEAKKENDWHELLHRPTENTNDVTPKKREENIPAGEENEVVQQKQEIRLQEGVPMINTMAQSASVAADSYAPHVTQLDTRNTFGHVAEYKKSIVGKHGDFSSVKDMLAEIQDKHDDKEKKSDEDEEDGKDLDLKKAA